MKIHIQIGLIASLLQLSTSFAQQLNLPLNFRLHLSHEKQLSGGRSHSAFRPLNENFLAEEKLDIYHDSMKVYYTVYAKLYKEHLFEIKGDDYEIFIDPLFNFEMGLDVSDSSGRGTIHDEGGAFYTNTRGIQVGGTINKNFSFYTSFYENQSFFPDYLRLFNNDRGELFWTGTQYRRQLAIVPGQGRAKAFKGTGFDYAMASGYVAFAPMKNIQLQFGHGKHFIGNGYRSLLLSDNAFNYPYWQIRTSFLKNKINYNFTYAYMSNLIRLPENTALEASFIGKNVSFSYLSIKPFPGTEIGFFEGTVWSVFDTTTGIKPAPLLSHNPIIGVAITGGFETQDQDVVFGINIKQRINEHLTLYGQYMLDDPKTKKSGFQIGAQLFEPFDISNLMAYAEFNKVRSYSYSASSTYISYSHYNQELAHPYGAGFNEFIIGAHYLHTSRFWASYKLNLAKMPGTWNDPDNGKSVFSPYVAGETPNDDHSNLEFHSFRIGYRCNVKTNMDVFLGVNYRESNEFRNHYSTYIHIGFKTGLINRYYDF